jgi:hypothetical protein
MRDIIVRNTDQTFEYKSDIDRRDLVALERLLKLPLVPLSALFLDNLVQVGCVGSLVFEWLEYRVILLRFLPLNRRCPTKVKPPSLRWISRLGRLH